MSQIRFPTPGPSGFHSPRKTATENALPLRNILLIIVRQDIRRLARELNDPTMAKEAMIMALEETLESVRDDDVVKMYTVESDEDKDDVERLYYQRKRKRTSIVGAGEDNNKEAKADTPGGQKSIHSEEIGKGSVVVESDEVGQDGESLPYPRKRMRASVVGEGEDSNLPGKHGEYVTKNDWGTTWEKLTTLTDRLEGLTENLVEGVASIEVEYEGLSMELKKAEDELEEEYEDEVFLFSKAG